MYSRCYFEEACNEYYIDIFHLREDNYFQLLFDEHTPPYEVNIINVSHGQVMTTQFQFESSLMAMLPLDPHSSCCHYMDDIFIIDGPNVWVDEYLVSNDLAKNL